MRRKIYDRLVQWKQERDGTTALMIEGARRVGKSYIVEEFLKNKKNWKRYRRFLFIKNLRIKEFVDCTF